jgi:hypothetical protein
MKTSPLWRCLSLALPAFALGGCYSVVAEKHTFVVSNQAKNDLSLVQVTMDGSAGVADMKFRAGYRDSSAVDEVLKGDSTPITTQSFKADDKDLNKAAAAISEELLKKLANAYATGASPERIRRIEEEITRARSLPRIIRAAGTSQVSEAPAEKFLIAFSADPSKVFKAIADTTARNESEGAIFKSLRDFSNLEAERRTSAQTLVKLTWESLLEPVRAGLPAEEAGDKTDDGHQRLLDQLRRYRTLLNDFLASQP